MADASEIKVAIEAAAHNAMQIAAQTVMNEYGVMIRSASFDWIDTSTPVEPSAVVNAVTLETIKAY